MPIQGSMICRDVDLNCVVLKRRSMKHLNSKGLADVINEMLRQDKKWGADRDLSSLMWNAILGEEVGEVSKAILEKNGLRDELVQVAAVALQWIENIDRNSLLEEHKK